MAPAHIPVFLSQKPSTKNAIICIILSTLIFLARAPHPAHGTAGALVHGSQRGHRGSDQELLPPERGTAPAARQVEQPPPSFESWEPPAFDDIEIPLIDSKGVARGAH